jgi:hypothetical protein
MAAAGIIEAHIARCLGEKGISNVTLRRHFERELQNSRNEVTALAMTKVVAAMGRNEPWAVCFYLKCRGGWQERQSVEHSGNVGTSINVTVKSVGE